MAFAFLRHDRWWIQYRGERGQAVNRLSFCPTQEAALTLANRMETNAELRRSVDATVESYFAKQRDC